MHPMLHAAVDVELSHPALQADLAQRSVREAATLLHAQEQLRGLVAYDPEHIDFYRLPQYRGVNFTVQYTPRRADRPQAPVECPVCKEAVERSGQMFVAVQLGRRRYFLLANPYPFMPSAVTVVADTHRSQRWDLSPGDQGEPAAAHDDSPGMLTADAAALAGALESHVVIWNGIRAGASLPRHAHLSAFELPVGHGPLAVEQVTSLDTGVGGWYGLADEYPIVFHFAQGSGEAVAEVSAAAMRNWHEIEGPAATGNLVATERGGTTRMWYFPRNVRYPRAPGLGGALGALELCGSFVLSSDWEFQALREGRINMRTLFAALRAVGPEHAVLMATDRSTHMESR